MRGTTPVGQWLRGGALSVRRVQRGTITITAATSNTATISAVDTLNTELVFLGQDYSNTSTNPAIGQARIALTNGTTVTATLNTTPGAQSVTVSFEVIEYQPGAVKSIQRGTVTGAAAATLSTAVDVTKSRLTSLGWTTTDTALDLSINAKLVLTNGTTVTQSGGVVTNITSGFQVVEFY